MATDPTRVNIFPYDDDLPSASRRLQDAELALDEQVDDADLIISEEETPPLGRSPRFEFGANRFVRADGGHAILETRGTGTLIQWIEKCLRTARGAHPVHPDGYGMERPFDMIGMPVTEIPLTNLYSRIKDALLFHPRITDVREFAALVDPDEEFIEVSFRVVTDESENVPMTVRLP